MRNLAFWRLMFLHKLEIWQFSPLFRFYLLKTSIFRFKTFTPVSDIASLPSSEIKSHYKLSLAAAVVAVVVGCSWQQPFGTIDNVSRVSKVLANSVTITCYMRSE